MIDMWWYLVAGLLTIYLYYRWAVAPLGTSWRNLDPFMFPLIVILAWPFCLVTILLALVLRGRKTHEV